MEEEKLKIIKIIKTTQRKFDRHIFKISIKDYSFLKVLFSNLEQEINYVFSEAHE